MPRPERPLQFDGSLLVEFAAGLRRLRQQAGSPTYRELARRTHYSTSTLSEAAGGRLTPSLAVTLAYVRACAGDAGEWERRWRTLVAEQTGEEHVECGEGQDRDRAPYRGLASYQVEDADWFHGREELVDDLVAKVRAQSFVAVFGPSGVGKSSVLRAGLIPKLTAVESTRVVLLNPGRSPVEELAVHLARLLDRLPGEIAAELVADVRNLRRLVRRVLVDEPPDAELVLVVDQFEEVFTLCQDTTERSWLVSALIEAGVAASDGCRVVLGVRADFYAHCLLHADLAAALRDGQFTVGPMSVHELRRAITLPARRADCVVETPLLTTLIAQSHDRTGVLPLLSHALLETWHRRKGNTLTLAGFERAGGIDGALAKTAEAVFTSLTDREQDAAKDLFLRLVALGERTEHTRRHVPRDDLGADASTVVDRLITARLIVVSDKDVEITHEALISAWPRLRTWLDEDGHALRLHRELAEATALWQEHQHDSGALLRGTRLAALTDWASSYQHANHSEQAFLRTSIAAHEHEQRIRRRRTHLMRGLVVALTILLVIATTSAIYATNAQQTAARQRNAAIALNAVENAAGIVGSNPALAARISLAAYRLHPSEATRNSLALTAAATSAVALDLDLDYEWTDQTVEIAPNSRVMGSTDTKKDVTTISTVALSVSFTSAILPGGQHFMFSRDGFLVATLDRNNVARVWSISDPAEPRIVASMSSRSSRPVRILSFSPDSSMLVTEEVGVRAGAPEMPTPWTVRVWGIRDIGHPRELAVIPFTDIQLAASFSNDGRSMVTFGPDHFNSTRFTLWDIPLNGAPRPAGRLRLESDIVSAEFLGQGHTFIAVDAGGGITSVSIGESDRMHTLSRANIGAHARASENEIIDMDTSPDGRSIVTVNVGGAGIIWDISKPAAPKQLTQVSRTNMPLRSARFSNDGISVLTIQQGSRYDVAKFVRWHLKADQSADVVCDETRPMTEAEWHTYLVDIPYQQPCV